MSAPEPVDNPHACTSCGRACKPCAEAAANGHPLPHTIRSPWCRWCASIYVDNAPDPETGRVHCAGCDAALPGLARFIASGLQRYPRLCGECRMDGRRVEPDITPPDRGEEPPPAGADPRAPVKTPTAADRARQAEIEQEANWRRGGFVPRTGPDTTESEHGRGAVAWTGNRNRM